MNIAWVLADGVALDPLLDMNILKNVGSCWGSWQTWRACQTDNVICNDPVKANDLITRKFQQTCNFYIPNSTFQQLGRPEIVRVYEGEFTHDVDHQDEIVAMHLASSSSDIVLLLGFDFAEQAVNPDRLQQHRAQNYRGLIRQAIKDNDHVQWLVVDHVGKIGPDLSILENLSQDTMSNVLALAGG
jgi:hypothetical protein